MNFDEAFQSALIKYVDALGYGGQARVCEKTGLKSTEVSAIYRKARTASEQNKHIIAEALGYSYEEFLKFGGWKPNRSEPEDSHVLPFTRRRTDTDPDLALIVSKVADIWDWIKDRPEEKRFAQETLDFWHERFKPAGPTRRRPTG